MELIDYLRVHLCRHPKITLSGVDVLMGGVNDSGQMGNGTTTPVYGAKTWVTTMSDVAYCTTMSKSCFAIKTDGSLWGWGNNQYHQLGDGTNETRLSPVKIMDNAAYVVAGNEGTLVVKQDGTLWGFGATRTERGATRINGDGKTPELLMEDVIFAELSYGGNFAFAIKSDTSLWGWKIGEASSPKKLADNVKAVLRRGPSITAVSCAMGKKSWAT